MIRHNIVAVGKLYIIVFKPINILSNPIILLNSFDVMPIDLKIANSCFLNSILVIIVLNIVVKSMRDITTINIYKNIDTNL